jgi:DGQHR domain-containing protein
MSRLKFQVLRGTVLGVKVYRGFGRLCDLSGMSKPDIYDQKKNPTGTQRDLSPRHAKEAYFYVKNNEFAFWPEVFLCVREPKICTFTADSKGSDYGTLTVDLSELNKLTKVGISRVDGNHRLHYADGKSKDFPPIEKIVSFCLAYDISLEEEIKLFRDINNNQKRMNTSHLDEIEVRLNPSGQLKRTDPDLYIAQQLSNDLKSPLNGRVYEGGVSIGPNAIPLRTLKTGIQYMRSRTIKLNALKDPDAQAKVIMNYFDAIKKWVPDAWKEPRQYIALRGVGLWGICFIGANVIDRVLTKGEFDTENMLKILRSGKTWDWSNKGEFQGLSGRGGAVKISEMVTGEFQEEGNLSPNELYRQIMSKK